MTPGNESVEMSRRQLYSLIALAAARTGLDWWLIYGVIEQESGFDPKSESSCGALGLMQLMPATFPAWSRTALLDAANNVKLGSEFLRECISMWSQESADERVRFGLASYNGGCGYVLEAQRQAAARGEDSHAWEAVADHIPTAIVDGKLPDALQIWDYVDRIWTRYEKRRATPVPASGPEVAATPEAQV